MLNVYFAHWPVEATLGEAMWGIFGGGYFSVSDWFRLARVKITIQIQFSCLFQVVTLCNTYISDITNQSNRTARISLLDAFVMLAMPFGNLIGARLFLHFGYYVTFATSGFFAFSGAVYVALVLKETVVKESKDEKEKQNIFKVVENPNTKHVPGALGEEPCDDGEVVGEASEWFEEGTHSLQLSHTCRPQSLL